MFDLTSSKLLILGIVALLVVGPKDLPMLLRTLGKYIGMIKRQASEFRSQFDDAMRDAELQQLKKDVESLGDETEKAVREGEQQFTREMAAVGSDVDGAISTGAGSGARRSPPDAWLPQRPAPPRSPPTAAARPRAELEADAGHDAHQRQRRPAGSKAGRTGGHRRLQGAADGAPDRAAHSG